ncbi:MAG: tetratricopeptide repeat protein [Anaerolineae bacterium]
MFQFDLTSLLPPSLKQQAVDAAVDFVSDQARKFLSEEFSGKIKKLRSDAAFQTAFGEGLQRAANRFAAEYVTEDEDLVAALTADKSFFQNGEIQKALLAILKKPGVYLADEQELVAQSFDSVLPNRLNRERVNRAVLAFLKCLAEEVWNLPELRPAYELQFQRMTAETLREQVNLQKAHLQTTAALSTDIRDALLQLTEAMAERKLLPGGEPLALPTPTKLQVHHNLPRPDYTRFVGRKAELKHIRQLLSPKTRHFVVTIDGIGGIGKSALALEVAHSFLRHYEQLPEAERFKAIIWTSAKQTVLTGEGIAVRSQALRTLDDIYSTIAITLEREDIPRARSEEQDELVRHALAEQRTLLIVDNLETVDDERVLTFIREVPDPTKVIVTTRHRLDVAYPVRLVGMDEADALTLIADEAKKKGVSLSDEAARRLYGRTGGVPLAIVWSVAQMGFGYGVEAVLARLGQPSSDIAKFCFEGAVERIKGKPAYKLLLALSLFATDASREALGYVADLPELDRDEGLVELEKLSLVNKWAGRFHLLPLTLTYIKAELTKEIELESSFRDRWSEFLLNFLSEQSRTRRYEGLESITPEIDNILDVIDWCWRINKLELFITLLEKVDFYLWSSGKWEVWNKYMELGLKAAISLEAELTQAKFLYLLASRRYFQDDLDEAKDFITTAIEIFQLHNNKRELAISIWRLASIQIQLAQYEIARENLNKALAIVNEIQSKQRVADIQCRLAMIDIAEGNYGSALSRLKQARDLHEQETQSSPGLMDNYRLLGQVSFLMQDYELAMQYFQRSLEIGQQIGAYENILATTKQNIAELELTLGRITSSSTNKICRLDSRKMPRFYPTKEYC